MECVRARHEEKRRGDRGKRGKRGGWGAERASLGGEKGLEREHGFYPSDEESTGDEKLG